MNIKTKDMEVISHDDKTHVLIYMFKRQAKNTNVISIFVSSDDLSALSFWVFDDKYLDEAEILNNIARDTPQHFIDRMRYFINNGFTHCLDFPEPQQIVCIPKNLLEKP